MEMTSTPFCSVFSGVSVEYSKEPLTTNACVVHYKRVSVLHVTSCPFILSDPNGVSIVL